MIFDDFCQKFQKNNFSDETLEFWDPFEELEGHTRGEKYPSDHFAPVPTLKTIKNR